MNVVYDVLSYPPPRGSYLSTLLMMVRMRREATDLHKTFALTDAARGDTISPEDLKKSLESYLHTAVPFLKKEMEQEDENLARQMREWTRGGPLRVSSLMSPVNSRLNRLRVANT